MRIALISHTNAPWTEKYARHFLRRGHGVRVFSLSDEPLAGIDVVHLRGSGALRATRAAKLLAAVSHLRRSLREFAPEVVLAPYVASNGVAAALSWRGPWVASARGGDVLPHDGTVPGGRWLHPAIVRFVCRRASHVHAVSEEIVERLAACGIAPERIAQFPLGVDLSFFRRSETTKAKATPARLVCTRRQERVYRNDVVVAALGRLRDRGASFIGALAGGGPLLAQRRRQVEALGLGSSVGLLGEIGPAEIRDLLVTADIYLSASSSDGASSSLLEAMACGVLPVVSRIPANEAWIQDGRNGLMFDASDPSDLDRALARALADATWRESAAAINRSIVERDADLVRNCDRMLELLHGVAGGSASQLRMPFHSSR